MSEQDEQKRAAAELALESVESGMLLGVGTGSTARFFIEGLSRRAAGGLRVTAVATSEETARMVAAAGIPVVDDIDRPIDLAVDGADEIDPALNLLKGHGGALFREKLVALAARRFLVIADNSKLVPRLGQTYVPVEVLPFLWRRTGDRLLALADRLELRGGEREPFRTDNGNLILDLTFEGGLPDLERTAAQIKSISGVLEHGLFLGIASACLIAAPEGVRVLEKS